ncbi:hypothetical protein [Streptomyces collinus]|uniref:hypothetical protein n=1 Tax=Streptomyces collinus TaxID=42684 RepID=UPI0036829168
MTAATYQYVDLPDASVVTTRALLTSRENITDTVAARRPRPGRRTTPPPQRVRPPAENRSG